MEVETALHILYLFLTHCMFDLRKKSVLCRNVPPFQAIKLFIQPGWHWPESVMLATDVSSISLQF